MTTLDLVVKGGLVYDGTGSAPRNADVGVKDGRITEIGKVTANARNSLDADGAIVTPGFVDIHTHYDGLATWSNQLSPSNEHGVTTVVMGNCGVGFAPCRQADHSRLIELMEGVEDIPGAALDEGLPWQWESFPEYLDYLAARQYDTDIAAQLPHAALRVYVMGERGVYKEAATEDDIREMRRITTEALKAGAVGFSSSRTINHRSSKGEHIPSLTAETRELLGIAEGIGDAGRGVIEMISDFEDLDAEFETFRQMVKLSRSPMSISLAQGLSPHGWRKTLTKLEEANRDGLVMRGQVAPRAIGILLGNTTTLNPFTSRPSYEEIARLPLAEKISALLDPERKARILNEAPSAGFQRLFRSMAGGKRLWDLGDPPNYEPALEDSLWAAAEAAGVETWSYIYDKLLENNGKTLLYSPFANYADDNLDCCRDMILHENTIMGLGDGGAHVGTICDASFTTTLLTHWGRDRSRGELLDLAYLIRRQTSDNARAMGLTDRGTLSPGMRADINVIDFNKLQTRAPEMVNDLPLGGARLTQHADGYIATVVNGVTTRMNGQGTGELPGRLIREY